MMEKKSQNLTGKTFEVKISTKGQIVIPADIRKKIDLSEGSTLQLSLNENDEIKIQKAPTALDWANLVTEGPIEQVVFNNDGTINSTKSPTFASWMDDDE
ncbi:AbrB/MazE/SpoVT family DNA-binding domain-containing protein [Levilactobacillus fujinensis]|uniref:AbrB/MazE/SpoVT family DNA-binding domain-containing protein n=1 Tax=Levilactobacillus fujinensis TaxID=2486024 RepID=A0ABW1TFH0_9LACO|nr:AbrB/MazE/SpoVT family DNA-binding domain-containing protein [Levilactobacillus fujinensis]